jgi:hypothetical protein
MLDLDRNRFFLKVIGTYGARLAVVCALATAPKVAHAATQLPTPPLTPMRQYQAALGRFRSMAWMEDRTA